MKTFAKSTEALISYLASNHDGEELSKYCQGSPVRIYYNDGSRADFSEKECACGWVFGCTMTAADGNEEEFIICEHCWEEADDRIE